MTIRQIGGVFGRNPKFSDVEAETLEVSGSITSGGDPTFEGASGRSLTLKNTSTAATAGNLIGEVLFFGSDASAPGAGIKSKIKVIADGGSGDGSRLFISTSDGVTNDIDRMEFTKDGDVKVLTGNVIMANGKGIDFSATSGTGTSELFDDYEEGTFTATFGSSTEECDYTKIGRQVICDILVNTNSESFSTITGLPFTNASGGYTGGFWGRSLRANILDANGVPCRISVSGTQVNFKTNVSTGSDADFTITTDASGAVRLGLTLVYFV